MSLYRWSLAFLQLGVLLLAIGVLPEAIAWLFGARPTFTALLLLSIGPLGGLVTITGLLMLAVALLRGRNRR